MLHALLVLTIPSLRKLLELNWNTPGVKEGSLNCEVAENSLFSYLYLYAKHKNLSSKKASVIVDTLKGWIVGALVGGFFITKISSWLKSSINTPGLGSP